MNLINGNCKQLYARELITVISGKAYKYAHSTKVKEKYKL